MGMCEVTCTFDHLDILLEINSFEHPPPWIIPHTMSHSITQIYNAKGFYDKKN